MTAANRAPVICGACQAMAAPEAANATACETEGASIEAAELRPWSAWLDNARTWVEIVGEQMPMPMDATAHRPRPVQAGTRSSASRAGPSDPALTSTNPAHSRATTDVRRCTAVRLWRLDPAAQKMPVMVRLTPAAAGPYRCTWVSMRGRRPATVPNDAPRSARSAVRAGMPGAAL